MDSQTEEITINVDPGYWEKIKTPGTVLEGTFGGKATVVSAREVGRADSAEGMRVTAVLAVQRG